MVKVTFVTIRQDGLFDDSDYHLNVFLIIELCNFGGNVPEFVQWEQGRGLFFFRVFRGKLCSSGQCIGCPISVSWSVTDGVVVMGQEVHPSQLSVVEHSGFCEVLEVFMIR